MTQNWLPKLLKPTCKGGHKTCLFSLSLFSCPLCAAKTPPPTHPPPKKKKKKSRRRKEEGEGEKREKKEEKAHRQVQMEDRKDWGKGGQNKWNNCAFLWNSWHFEKRHCVAGGGWGGRGGEVGGGGFRRSGDCQHKIGEEEGGEKGVRWGVATTKE